MEPGKEENEQENRVEPFLDEAGSACDMGDNVELFGEENAGGAGDMEIMWSFLNSGSLSR